MAEGIRYTYEEVKEIAKEKGYTLISDTYKNARTKIDLKDKEGFKYSIALGNLLESKTPRKYDRRNPFSIENFNFFLKNSRPDLKLEEKEFKGTNGKYRFSDQEGYKYEINMCDLLLGKGFYRYSTSNTYSIYNLKNFIKLNNLDCVLLEENYVSNSTPMKFKCKCGKEYETTSAKLISRKKQFCNECSLIEKGLNRRTEMKENIEFARKYGFKILEEGYKYLDELVDLMDEQGYKYRLKLRNIGNYKSQPFLNTNPHTIENIKRYFELNNIDCELLSTEYTSNTCDLELKCSCGSIFESKWCDIQSNNKYRCKKCSGSESIGEMLVRKWLEENHYSFKQEVAFKDCKSTKGSPRFDFKIETNSGFILCEFDGIQHFEPIEVFGGEEAFESQKERDKLKDDYCFKNGIKLIRIPYWSLKNEEYKVILENELKPVSIAN